MPPQWWKLFRVLHSQILGLSFPSQLKGLQSFADANYSQFEKRTPLKVWGLRLQRAGNKIVKDLQPFGAVASSSVGGVKLHEIGTSWARPQW